MKEVIIKSKIVGKESAIGSGKPIAFPDLSAYALRSDFIRLESSFNDFLEGDDTDNVINRWKELEAFLNNISEDYNLLSLLNGKADKATTLSGYGITDAYTKTNVDDLLKTYVTLSGSQTITGEKNFVGGLKVNGRLIYYDSTKKYWKLEGDLLVTGGVTMYGSDSSFTPSTIMDAIVVDNVTIIKQDGKLVALGGGLADAVAWGNILGKPSWITDTTPSISISGTSVSLGGIITQSALRNALGLGSNAYTSTAYLPLSGGEIKGVTTINGDSKTNVPIVVETPSMNYNGYIKFASSGTTNGYLGLGGKDKPVFRSSSDTNYAIWHEGNDGSGSGLDADLLDGYHRKNWNGIPTVLSNGVMDIGKYIDFHNASGDGLDYAIRLECQGAYNNWVYLPSKTGTLALTIDNVASATKLQTARTIWGQSFDGTGNVDGDITIKGAILGKTSTTGALESYMGNASGGVNGDGALMYAYGYRNLYFYTNGTQRMIVDSSGNVGIGTESPAYKLDVNGTLGVRGNLTIPTGYGYTLTCNNVQIPSNGDRITFNSLTGTYTKGILAMNTGNTYIQAPLSSDSSSGAQTPILIGWTNGVYATYIAPSGNVGIGTTSPSSKLHVSGDILATNSVANSSWVSDSGQIRANAINTGYYVGIAASNDGYAVIQGGNTGVGSIPLLLNPNGDSNVGVGIANPMQRLHIDGILRVQRYGDVNSYIDIQSNDISVNYKGYDKSDGYCYHVFYSNDTELVRFSGVDNIATFQGNILARGGITMYSMRALKNVVDERGLSLTELSAIKPTRYTWKDGRDNRLHFGGIADDIQQVLPEVVYKTSDGVLTMDYGNAAFAVASSLIQPVVDHEKRIAMLQERIDELEEEVERLKAS